MASRSLFTLSTASGLTLLYWAYALVIGPHLEPRPPQTADQVRVQLQNIAPPRGQAESAAEWLPDVEWATRAKYQVKTDRGFVYYQTWEPIREEGRIRISPFATIWHPPEDKPDQAPVCIVSDEAVVQFEGTFEGKHPDPGKIMAAALQGEVRITGPDGVRITGHNYTFSQTAMRIWSDNPVTFAGQGHHGTARGIQIELKPDTDAESSSALAIAGIESVRLRKDVVFNMQAPDPDDKSRTVPVLVKAAGSFEYLMPRQLAIFEDDVRIYQQTGLNAYDSLEADRLYLQFAEAAQASGNVESTALAESTTDDVSDSFTGLSGRLTLARLRAEGQEVKLTSQQNQLVATMSELTYDAITRTLSLSHPELVRVAQGYSDLVCQKINITHNEEGAVTHVLAPGAGQVNVFDPDSREHLLAGRWQKQLRKWPTDENGEQLLELDGSVLLQQPTEQIAMAAGYVKLWLKELPPESRTSAATLSPEETDSAFPKQPKSRRPKIRVRPSRLLALQDVSLISQELRGMTKRLEIWFQPGEVNRSGQATPIATTAPPGNVVTASAEAPDNQSTKPPVQLSSDLIQVRVQLDSQSDEDAARQKAQIAEVWTSGAVQIRQEHKDPGKAALSAKAQRLHIINRSKDDQRLEFTGKPASIHDQGMRIEGNLVTIDRGTNVASVKGAGVLELPVDRNLNGEKMATQQMLEVWWKEEMSFDGQIVRFYGNVKAELDRSTMTCQQMRVELTERIDFQQTKRSDRNSRPDLARVYCKDGVEIDSQEYTNGILTEVRKAHFWECTLNQTSGRMQAYGPGWITAWRRDDGENKRRGLPGNREDAQVQPNPAADGKEKPPAWEYTRIDFTGLVDGNVKQRFTTFNEQVQVVYGPVDKATDSVDPDDLPKGAGWMRCQTLQMTHHKKTATSEDRIEMYAEGNAELEGESFNARADTISFDEGKDLYILRSFGNRQASIWLDGNEGPQRRGGSAQRIEFMPSRNQFVIHRATSFGVGN